jgi:hypothetical protein
MDLARENEELRHKLEEVERFNRFSVGRERRIKELKARIETLEEQLLSYRHSPIPEKS